VMVVWKKDGVPVALVGTAVQLGHRDGFAARSGDPVDRGSVGRREDDVASPVPGAALAVGCVAQGDRGAAGDGGPR